MNVSTANNCNFKSKWSTHNWQLYLQVASHSVDTRKSWTCPTPEPALASVAKMEMSSANGIPSDVGDNKELPNGMRQLRRVKETSSGTGLFSSTMYFASICNSWRFSSRVALSSLSNGRPPKPERQLWIESKCSTWHLVISITHNVGTRIKDMFDTVTTISKTTEN